MMTDKAAWLARFVFLTLVAIFLAMPLIVVSSVSFNDTAQMVFPPQGLSLRWYEEFFNDPTWVGAFERSVIIALSASVLSTSLALPIAYAQWKHRSKVADALAALGGLPFILPPVVIAIVFLLFWGIVQHVGRIENIIVSHAITFVAMPLVMITLGFASVEQTLVEAAETMGAREDQVFRSIALPIVLPFIIASLIFVTIFSLNEYLIAYMVGGFATQTLPVKIFSSMRTGFTPTMCVAAVLFLTLGLAGFLAIARLGNLPKLMGAKG
ncbi:spermidine/putrescine ABC transporter permease [Devosia pacifica]|uniref:Spermidine/putrescine ABC transporter permease n=1 Tax=Devosia pacifica TaxID=1335967 RepID=A0A918VQ71_9HYPH|nr:ABC transporter permease [Devosia pacifica]GHA13656.1 spermidine/putrescine ABC transporter permease [Devosia pacifica]